MAVTPGRATVLLGRNGAGKSTTMRTVMGLAPASARAASALDGGEITKARPYEMAQAGVGFRARGPGGDLQPVVEENFRLAMLNENEESWKRMDTIFELFPALKKFWRSKAGVLSGGQKQMLAIARAFVGDHKLLLIDEPSKGLAPIVVDQLIESLNHIKGTPPSSWWSRTSTWPAHVGSEFFILDDGRVVHQGLMEELVGDHELKQKYLGMPEGAEKQ